MFNQLLLIACICIVAALILYFFYWNRFIAFIIGHAIRILFWNQEDSSIWIEIGKPVIKPWRTSVSYTIEYLGSIHFSLLTGRILLKDVRYHSSNQTIKLVKGQIQWRYWIRRPTSEEELNSVRSEDSKPIWTFSSLALKLSQQNIHRGFGLAAFNYPSKVWNGSFIIEQPRMMVLWSKWRKKIGQPLARAPIASFLVDFRDKVCYLHLSYIFIQLMSSAPRFILPFSSSICLPVLDSLTIYNKQSFSLVSTPIAHLGPEGSSAFRDRDSNRCNHSRQSLHT